ncbi:hypothetical protein ACFQPA_05420 [Halomarina halobia]|uniref:Uncharacterized protein n=1 Tax=Halomarina halobia TaxID=3033386 RepID=A0ABD6A5G7_9EURY|nr:hypothetical protein [Halomarina sp. PSR21]
MTDRDDLPALLDDLSATLDELRAELEADGAERRADRGPEARDRTPWRRSRHAARPRPGEFLRFTEEYTIPTLISFLEANIRALELLRGVLRLTGGRGLPATDRDDERVTTAGRRALDGVDAVLADLQDALEARPTDENARDLLDDARSLRREIDGAIGGRADERRVDRDRRPRREPTDAISIAVTDETADGGDGNEGEDPDGPEVDVDAELDAIRREVRPDEDDGASPDASERPSRRRARDDDEDRDGS